MPKTTSTRGGHPWSHNRDNAINWLVAKQVDQFLLWGIEMDDDMSSATLGLTGEEAEAVQEMQPDILKIAQGEEKKKCCAQTYYALTMSIGSHSCRIFLYPPSIGFGDHQEDCHHQIDHIRRYCSSRLPFI